MTFKPLLATTYDAEKTPITYPVLCSPKLDGIRCVVKYETPVTRALKPIPNKALQDILSGPALDWLDGELIVGHPASEKVFNRTTRVVMKQDLPITTDLGLAFYIFDDASVPSRPFKHRLAAAQAKVVAAKLNRYFPIDVMVIPHTQVNNEDELHKAYDAYLQLGYEGIMIRDPEAPYKFGRSTPKERILIKMKPHADSEATILHVEELLINGNEQEVNELGYARRSSSMEGLMPGGVMGALVVQDVTSGVQFSIGTGFTAAQRELFWKYRDRLIGKTVKYKYFPIGVVDKPRHPVFIGFREAWDMEPQV